MNSILVKVVFISTIFNNILFGGMVTELATDYAKEKAFEHIDNKYQIKEKVVNAVTSYAKEKYSPEVLAKTKEYMRQRDIQMGKPVSFATEEQKKARYDAIMKARAQQAQDKANAETLEERKAAIAKARAAFLKEKQKERKNSPTIVDM